METAQRPSPFYLVRLVVGPAAAPGHTWAAISARRAWTPLGGCVTPNLGQVTQGLSAEPGSPRPQAGPVAPAPILPAPPLLVALHLSLSPSAHHVSVLLFPIGSGKLALFPERLQALQGRSQVRAWTSLGSPTPVSTVMDR